VCVNVATWLGPRGTFPELPSVQNHCISAGAPPEGTHTHGNLTKQSRCSTERSTTTQLGHPARLDSAASSRERCSPRGLPLRMGADLLRTVYSVVILATTVVSALWAEQNLYGGRSAAHVWWYGWITALSTGLGALPFAFIRSTSEWWLGVANAVAGGMMTAASLALVQEGLELGVDERSPFTPLQCVGIGALTGVAFVYISQRILEGYGDVRLDILEGVDVRRALLIVVVMTVHSFSEGIGIGVSFGGKAASQLGMLVTTTLAVHNVPEGFAISMLLISKGMSVWGAALWSITTSIPQPVMAIASYLFVDSFVLIQPAGLGFAAGAMLWVAWVELFVDASEACGIMSTSAVGLASACLMHACHAHLL